MAIINYTDQIKYTGKGYLDAKMMPVATVDDLKKISRTQRFEGLTITVLNNGNPQDYWLIGGTKDSNWTLKDTSNLNELKLRLENGFLKLINNGVELGEPINVDDFFPETEVSIKDVEYTTNDDVNNNGIFMCFTYTDETKKYLNMSQFLSNIYTSGEGIIINDNVISIDDALIGKINTLETDVKTVSGKIEDIKTRLENLSKLNEIIQSNTDAISKNTTDITELKDKINAITSTGEGLIPDGETIGIKEDESKALYVKILNKDGNMVKVDTNNNGEVGIFASISYFEEDEELL